MHRIGRQPKARMAKPIGKAQAKFRVGDAVKFSHHETSTEGVVIHCLDNRVWVDPIDNGGIGCTVILNADVVEFFEDVEN